MPPLVRIFRYREGAQSTLFDGACPRKELLFIRFLDFGWHTLEIRMHADLGGALKAEQPSHKVSF